MKRDENGFCPKARHPSGEIFNGALSKRNAGAFSLFLVHYFFTLGVCFKEFRNVHMQALG